MTNVVTLETKPPSAPTPALKVHVMIDVETLGMDANAIVLSIGAVSFRKDRIDLDFYTEIDPSKYPGNVDLSTIKFWMEQERNGTKCPINGKDSLQEAIVELGSYLSTVCQGDFNNLVIWANGTDFDIPKLQYMYKVLGIPVPWKYSNVRDCRTIFKLFSSYGIKPPEIDKHDALADAQWQAGYLISILANLGESNVIDF